MVFKRPCDTFSITTTILKGYKVFLSNEKQIYCYIWILHYKNDAHHHEHHCHQRHHHHHISHQCHHNISDDCAPVMGCVNTPIYEITLKIQLLNSKGFWVRECIINHKTHIKHTD